MARWPYAPSHEVIHPGAFIVTAATYGRRRLFDTSEKLTFLEDALLAVLDEFGWRVQAWAVMANHYHFVALSPDESGVLAGLLKKLHANTARVLNKTDGISGRMVWDQYWDTRISFERSYLARLAYVHNNPVKHGLVPEARLYPWCSASWFELRAERSFYETVMSFRTDRVSVYDEF